MKHILLLFAFLLLLMGFYSETSPPTGEAIMHASSFRSRLGTNLDAEDLPPVPEGYSRRVYLTNPIGSRRLEKTPVFVSTRLSYGVQPSRVGTYLSRSNNPFAGTEKGDLDGDGELTRTDLRLLSQVASRTSGRRLDSTIGKAFNTFFCAGFGTLRQKYCGNLKTDISRADLNFDGRADEADFNLLAQVVYNQGIGRLEDTYSRQSSGGCSEEGQEFVNVDGQKCRCEVFQYSTGASFHGMDYFRVQCEDSPLGYRFVQSGHGQVRELPSIPYRSPS